MKGEVKPEDEDLSYPPTIEGEIERLKTELENYRNDNIYRLFWAVNRKAGEIASALNDAELKLTGDDKVFDRFVKLMEKLEPMVKTLNTLRLEYLSISEDEVKKGEPRIPNTMEDLLKQKKEARKNRQ